MKVLRLYTLKGCPNCDETRNFLKTLNIEMDEIEVGIDPIAQGGIRALVGGIQAPIIISFLTNDVIVGHNQEKLNELATFVSQLRAGASNTATS